MIRHFYEALDDLQFLVNHLLSQPQFSPHDDFKRALHKRLQLVRHGKVNGIVLYSQHKPVGFGWVEPFTPEFASMSFYALESRFCMPLVRGLYQSGYMSGKLLELISFNETFDYASPLTSLGYHQNDRVRMVNEFKTFEFPEPNLGDLTLVPWTDVYYPISGYTSFLAHGISRDQPTYPSLFSIDRRIELSLRVSGGFYGPFLGEASYVALKNGRPIGFLEMVEISYWNIPKLPWIFDVYVHPEFMGQGIGKQLILTSIHQLIAMGYSHIGLGVTLSNEKAHALYKKLGFWDMEFFSEFGHLPRT